MQVPMGLSAREIGEVMGVSQGAVLIRLHRARLILRSRYGLDEPRAKCEPSAVEFLERSVRTAPTFA